MVYTVPLLAPTIGGEVRGERKAWIPPTRGERLWALGCEIDYLKGRQARYEWCWMLIMRAAEDRRGGDRYCVVSEIFKLNFDFRMAF